MNIIANLFAHKKKAVAVPQQAGPQANEAMKWLIAEHIKPFLQQAGFAKYGMTFHRTRGDIIDVINFQSDKWNGFGNHTYYINCGMDSLRFQMETTGRQNRRPHYSAYLYHDRIEDFAGGDYQYVVAKNYRVADLEKMAEELLLRLQKVLAFYAQATSVDDLIDLSIERNGLKEYEEICYYLTQHHDKVRLVRYIRDLHSRFSKTDDRWPIFADAIHAVVGNYATDPAIAKLLKGHAPPTTYTPKRFKPPEKPKPAS